MEGGGYFQGGGVVFLPNQGEGCLPEGESSPLTDRNNILAKLDSFGVSVEMNLPKKHSI